jgi:hypothetical protein
MQPSFFRQVDRKVNRSRLFLVVEVTRNRHSHHKKGQNSAMLRLSCAFVPETAMRRREFIALLGGMAFARPTITRAQQVERVRQISVLMPFTESDLEGGLVLRHSNKALSSLDGVRDAQVIDGSAETLLVQKLMLRKSLGCGRMRS